MLKTNMIIFFQGFAFTCTIDSECGDEECCLIVNPLIMSKRAAVAPVDSLLLPIRFTGKYIYFSKLFDKKISKLIRWRLNMSETSETDQQNWKCSAVVCNVSNSSAYDQLQFSKNCAAIFIRSGCLLGLLCLLSYGY